MTEDYKKLFFNDFLRDTATLTESFKKAFYDLKAGDDTALKTAHRAMHSLIGLALMMDQKSIVDLAKSVEAVIKPAMDGESKLDQSTLDSIGENFAALEKVVNSYLEGKSTEETFEEASSEAFSNRVKKILLVEDTVGISKAIKYRLEKKGFHVSQAFDGEEALEKVPTYAPDIILLDAFLPKMNGLDVCKTLQKDDKYKDIPIVIISASEENKALSEEAGAKDFVLKPYDPEDLIKKINKYIKK